ncbi:MAG: addiction module protein [Aureliella sp.]
MRTIDELRTLTPEKKLEIVTQLWDDLAASAAPLVLPPDELAEMERRREELRKDPSLAIDSEEVWRRVNAR